MDDPPTADLLGLSAQSEKSGPQPPSRPAPPVPGRSAPPPPAGPKPVPTVPSKPVSQTSVKSFRKPAEKSGNKDGKRPRPIIQVLDARPMSEVNFRGQQETSPQLAHSQQATIPKPAQSQQATNPKATHSQQATSPKPAHSQQATSPKPAYAPNLPARPPPPSPKQAASAGMRAPPVPKARDTLIQGLDEPPPKIPDRSSSLEEQEVEVKDRPRPSPRAELRKKTIPQPRPRPRPTSVADMTDVKVREVRAPPARPKSVVVLPPRPAAPIRGRHGVPHQDTEVSTPESLENQEENISTSSGHTDSGTFHKTGPTLIRPQPVIKTPVADTPQKPGVDKSDEVTGEVTAVDRKAVPPGEQRVHAREAGTGKISVQAAAAFIQPGQTSVGLLSQGSESKTCAAQTSLDPQTNSTKPALTPKPKIAAKPSLKGKPGAGLPSKPLISPSASTSSPETVTVTHSSCGESLINNAFLNLKKVDYGNEDFSKRQNENSECPSTESKQKSVRYDKPLPRNPTVIGVPRSRTPVEKKKVQTAEKSDASQDGEDQSDASQDGQDQSDASQVSQDQSDSKSKGYDNKPLPPKPAKKRPTIIGRPKSKLITEQADNEHKSDTHNVISPPHTQGDTRSGEIKTPQMQNDTSLSEIKILQMQNDPSLNEIKIQQGDSGSVEPLIEVMKSQTDSKHEESSSDLPTSQPFIATASSERPQERLLDVEQKTEKKSPGRPPPVNHAPQRPQAPPARPPQANPHRKDKTSTDASQPVKMPPAKPPRARPTVRDGPPDLPERPGPGHPLFHYTVTGPHGIAIYDYNTTEKDELSFTAGDVIILLKHVNSEWLYGRNVDREGMFPQGFIDVIEPLKEAADMAKSTPGHQKASPKPERLSQAESLEGPRCVARFDFEGEAEGDLSFKAGALIQLTGQQGEWLTGKLDNQTGSFPLSFVEIIENLPVEGQKTTNKGNVVTAAYEYIGDSGDLSFKAGSQINVLGRMNAQWLFGELDGKTGPFPESFVDDVPENIPMYKPKEDKLYSQHSEKEVDASKAGTETCVALYRYEADGADDLSFEQDDRITVIEKISTDWWRGKLGDKEGMFPAAFVKLHEGEYSSPVMTATSTGTAKALYDFPGEAEGDLSFKAGDMITLLEEVSAEWMKGSLGGREGVFPSAFVEVTKPLA